MLSWKITLVWRVGITSEGCLTFVDGTTVVQIVNPRTESARLVRRQPQNSYKRGKVKKRYPYSNMKTPYEKLKSLPNANSHLKKGVTFNLLDERA